MAKVQEKETELIDSIEALNNLLNRVKRHKKNIPNFLKKM